MINIFKIGIFKKMLSSRLGRVLFEGKEQPGVVCPPYGMFVNIEEGIPVGILLDQGNEEGLYLFPFDIENRETLGKNELAFGIPSGKDRIYFRDGKITFKIGDTEGGDFLARFNELKAGFDELKQDHNDLVTAFNLLAPHTHPVQVVPATGTGATTGIIPVVPSESPSTASIDDAKIDEIEVPEL